MKIELDFTPDYNSEELQQSIKDAIVDKMLETYMTNIEKSFTKKLETQILTEVNKIVKGMSKIYVEKCDTKDGVKESMTIEQFVISKATGALTTKVDDYGRSDYNSSNNKKTPIEWLVEKSLKNGQNEFVKELQEQCDNIRNQYQADLEKMVVKTLAPLYKELRKQIKA